MKTELRPGLTPDVIELWHDGRILGLLTGAEGPGVVLVSKYLRNHGAHLALAVVEPTELRVRLDPDGP